MGLWCYFYLLNKFYGESANFSLFKWVVMDKSAKRKLQMASAKQKLIRNSRNACASQYAGVVAKEGKCNI